MKDLLERLQWLATHHGGSLKDLRSFLPLDVEANTKTKGDFSRGVLAAVAAIHVQLSETPEGRQAMQDLGFQPFLQNVEGE